MMSSLSKMQHPKVAIITSTLNQEENLRKCLRSLKKNANYKDYKMYFVDDSGTGEIAKRIKKNFPGWMFLQIKRTRDIQLLTIF